MSVSSKAFIDLENNENPNKTYVTSIRINCVDKMGMLKDILVKAADCGTNITYANVKTNHSKKIGIIELGVEVNGIDNLTQIINAFQSLPDVHSVKRIQMNSKIKLSPELKQQTKTKTKKQTKQK